jgi:hypothetical protein
MERCGKRVCLDIGPNILNLKQWIPQKDVIRLILKRLNQADWHIVWAAHSKKYEKRLREHDWFWLQCALYGYLDLILWGINLNAYHFTPCGSSFLEGKLLNNAAKGGHLHILKWSLYQQSVPRLKLKINTGEISVPMTAMEYGHVECVEWFINHTNFFGTKHWMFYSKAAQRSSIDVMELLKKHKVPMNWRNCATAATYGQLDALKWLRTNRCQWDEFVVIEAARHKHKHVLEWAIENGCPHDLEVLKRIVWNNDDHPFKLWFEQRFIK